MRILVFQHIACEHPGSLRALLVADGIAWDAVELDEGEAIPALEPYDALWVLGGPMDVWDVVRHPWLRAEKRAIRRWVRELNRPYLGLCLGHQLLADALGGTCGPQRPPEIGVLDIELTGEAKNDSVFATLPKRQKALQWHSVEVAEPPEDAVVLARSEICPVQAMRVGDRAWSMQYHVEIEPDTIAQWGCVPAYQQALEASQGTGALASMAAAAVPHLSAMRTNAEMIYRNFMRAARPG